MSRESRRSYVGDRQATSNSDYGEFFDHQENRPYRKTSLFFVPSTLRNRTQEKLRQRLYTSNDEYGHFYTKTLQLPPIVETVKQQEAEREAENKRQNHEDDERKQWKLPDIDTRGQQSGLELVKYEDGHDEDRFRGISLNDIIRLPDVKQIDIALHLDDDSIVTLHTLPRKYRYN